MTRSAFFLILCAAAAVVIGSLTRGANPGAEGEPSIENSLAVQKAMVQARDYLLRSEPKKAVDVLEANLAKIQGDGKYLALLRDSYRSYIKDLTLAHQQALVDVYQKRLTILENQEASKQGAVAAVDATPPQVTATTAAESTKLIASPPPTPTPTFEHRTPNVSLAVRPDPFDAGSELKPATVLPHRPSPAKSLLAKADEQFAQKHYAEAKQLYELAYQNDAKAMTDDGRGRWGYCQLQLVVDQINRSAEQPCDWAKLESDVKSAVAAAPHLAQTGTMILGEVAKRRGAAPVIRAAMLAVAVKHTPKGDHGWLMAETTNFRIFHNQTQEFAESVAQTAEATRSQMSRKWFGKDIEDWTPKCDIYLHANSADYSQHTRQNAASPGHSRIDLDPSAGRVVVRQVHLRCDNPALLIAVLPHETTHVVLGGQFGPNRHVPRWIDEGVAVLTEPAEKIQQHRANLAKAIQSYKLIPIRELLEMDSYPSPAQIPTFYGQSVALVDFLTKQKGPVVLMQFARDALQGGYEPALKKHYGYASIAEFQDRFTAYVLADANGAKTTAATP
jgi:hypothetical protein